MLAINFHDALRADVSSGNVQQEEVFKNGVTVLLLTAVVPTASRDSFLKHTVKILFRFTHIHDQKDQFSLLFSDHRLS